MKSYIKGMITGFIAAAVTVSVPAVADSIDALFNTVRININGVDRVQWGEEIQLDNGITTPYSILYNGTTYLPMRKIGELSGKKIYWNGDTQTVSMTDSQKDIKELAQKPDKNGNVWKYYTFETEDGEDYLGVKDEARGYERVYLMASESVRVTDNEIYFLRLLNRNYNNYEYRAELMKLYFNSDTDTEDGACINTIYGINGEETVFDGDYLYYSYTMHGANPYPSENLRSYNYITDTYADTGNKNWTKITDLKLLESDDGKAVLKYTMEPEVNSPYEVEAGDVKVTFDKTINTFGEHTETLRTNE